MSLSIRRTTKGTTVRASGVCAQKMFDALTAGMGEPDAQKGAAEPPQGVPKRSKPISGAPGAGKGAEALNAAAAKKA